MQQLDLKEHIHDVYDLEPTAAMLTLSTAWMVKVCDYDGMILWDLPKFLCFEDYVAWDENLRCPRSNGLQGIENTNKPVIVN